MNDPDLPREIALARQVLERARSAQAAVDAIIAEELGHIVQIRLIGPPAAVAAVQRHLDSRFLLQSRSKAGSRKHAGHIRTYSTIVVGGRQEKSNE